MTTNIQNKINRLESARALCIEQLKKKGVDVLDNEGYENFALLIESIKAENFTGATAKPEYVLSPYKFIGESGIITTGTMSNQGAVSKTLTTSSTSYTIPSGYHNGSGKVNIALSTKSVTPTASQQTITPTSGTFLSQVTVAAKQQGGTVYTGSIDGMYSSSTSRVTINVGRATSSAKAFFIAPEYSFLTNVAPVCMMARVGTSNYGAHLTYSDRVEMITPTITYSGNNVYCTANISEYSYWYAKYYWAILI